VNTGVFIPYLIYYLGSQRCFINSKNWVSWDFEIATVLSWC